VNHFLARTRVNKRRGNTSSLRRSGILIACIIKKKKIFKAVTGYKNLVPAGRNPETLQIAKIAGLLPKSFKVAHQIVSWLPDLCRAELLHTNRSFN
jgi:hypothetical protein